MKIKNISDKVIVDDTVVPYPPPVGIKPFVIKPGETKEVPRMGIQIKQAIRKGKIMEIEDEEKKVMPINEKVETKQSKPKGRPKKALNDTVDKPRLEE